MPGTWRKVHAGNKTEEIDCLLSTAIPRPTLDPFGGHPVATQEIFRRSRFNPDSIHYDIGHISDSDFSSKVKEPI